MQSATKRQGLVDQKTAIEHLKLTAASLRSVPHDIIRLGMGRVRYMYPIDGVLRVATEKYGSVQALQLHLHKCLQRKAVREKNLRLKLQRREELIKALHGINADFFITAKQSQTYVNTGKGSVEQVCETACEEKRVRDARAKKAAAIEKRRTAVSRWSRGMVSAQYYERNAVINQYIYHAIGDENTVTRACEEEKTALEHRRQSSLQTRDSRRAALIAELQVHGLILRPDSRFCSQYIMGETNASLEEVVATMELTAFLFDYDHITWSNWHNTLEYEMRKSVRSGEIENWYDACRHVISKYQDDVENDSE